MLEQTMRRRARTCSGHSVRTSFVWSVQSAVAVLLCPRNAHAVLPLGNRDVTAVAMLPASFGLDRRARRAWLFDQDLRASTGPRLHIAFELRDVDVGARRWPA